jgi:hypothetical protein
MSTKLGPYIFTFTDGRSSVGTKLWRLGRFVSEQNLRYHYVFDFANPLYVYRIRHDRP